MSSYISKKIIINRRRRDIWGYVTQPVNWKDWWGGGLKEVYPEWKQGARLLWDNGPYSVVVHYELPHALRFEGPDIRTSLKLTWSTKGKSTEVELGDWPHSGAVFRDGGASRLVGIQTQLDRLKSLVEAATPAPGPPVCGCRRPAVAYCEDCDNERCDQHLTPAIRGLKRLCFDCARRCAVCNAPTVTACPSCWKGMCHLHLVGTGDDQYCAECTAMRRRRRRRPYLIAAGVALIAAVAIALYLTMSR